MKLQYFSNIFYQSELLYFCLSFCTSKNIIRQVFIKSEGDSSDMKAFFEKTSVFEKMWSPSFGIMNPIKSIVSLAKFSKARMTHTIPGNAIKSAIERMERT